MFKNKQQKTAIMVGFPMFLIGSVLFWFFMSKNTNTELNFLKPTYFVGLIITPAYFIFQGLSEKFKTEKNIKDKVKIALLFLFIAIILYFFIVLILKKF